jgi:hypothetical protein
MQTIPIYNERQVKGKIKTKGMLHTTLLQQCDCTSHQVPEISVSHCVDGSRRWAWYFLCRIALMEVEHSSSTFMKSHVYKYIMISFFYFKFCTSRLGPKQKLLEIEMVTCTLLPRTTH